MSRSPSCGASPHLNLTDLVTSAVIISISHPDVNRLSVQNNSIMISHFPQLDRLGDSGAEVRGKDREMEVTGVLLTESFKK